MGDLTCSHTALKEGVSVQAYFLASPFLFLHLPATRTIQPSPQNQIQNGTEIDANIDPKWSRNPSDICFEIYENGSWKFLGAFWGGPGGTGGNPSQHFGEQGATCGGFWVPVGEGTRMNDGNVIGK